MADAMLNDYAPDATGQTILSLSVDTLVRGMTELVSARAEVESTPLSGRESSGYSSRNGVDDNDALLRALIDRVAVADAAALEELYDATVAKLYAVARLILRHNEDAEEAVCDAYAQIWREACRYDKARANVLGWMLVICRARALDLLRRRRVRLRVADRQASEPVELSSPAADELLQSLQSGSAVYRALQGLSDIRRQLIEMAFLQDMSHEEIAAQTALPIGTVKSHIRRGLGALRAAIEAEGGL